MAQYGHDSIQGGSSEKKDPSALEADKHQLGAVPEYDDPFGNEEFAEVKYRTLAWW